MTAVFEITDDPHWRDHYDITVYQLGWRLGGKGASGRNARCYERIEEHGLHILMGFYENAFSVLRRCYDELGRGADEPLASWRQAFAPHDYIVLMERVGQRWVPWPMNFPRNGQEPGSGGELPSPWSFIEMIVGWLEQLFVRSKSLPSDPVRWPEIRLKTDMHDASLHEPLVELHQWLHGLVAEGLESDMDLRRDFVTVDLAVAAMRGMIADGIVWPPHDWWSIDDSDFRAWLTEHGAHPVSVQSAYLKGMYDLGFSGPGQIGAGTALHGILRLVWTYKGAVFWKMQAGMGDTIFAPLYQVLMRRGVRFEFFHRVDELTASAAGDAVERITIGRQVTPVDGTYDPLIGVKGLPCWPSEPLYDRIVEGEALRAAGGNLEDWWTSWKDSRPPLVLERGRDFDDVILGISIAAFPHLCKSLLAISAPLAAMVEHVGTTQTQAVQLWMTRDLRGLGWAEPSPVLDAYADPLNTWADMTHLVPREAWPVGSEPGSIAYLCAALADDEPVPPQSDHGYAARQKARVRVLAQAWLDCEIQPLWPEAARRGDVHGLDWSVLAAPSSDAAGAARLDTQYWVATYNPSDRYVLSLPGSVGYRLASHGTCFANLYMAGDYLRTGMNVGCVEAAAMGGMHASRAICGRPVHIVGDATRDGGER